MKFGVMACKVCMVHVAIFSATLASAANTTTFCTTGNTTEVYFVNGVWNSPNQAEDSRIAVEEAYKQQLESQYPQQSFEFKLAYNRHRGKVKDLVEVIGQKINEINDTAVSRHTPEQYLRWYQTAQEFDDVAPLAAQPLTSTIEEYLAARISDQVNAAWHIQLYRSSLLEGKRVLLLPHSQGNMLATEAIRVLMREYPSSIGMIGVASPAAVTYNNTPYYTAHDDRVIDALRLLHNVLPSNVANDPGLLNDPRDFSNHKFEQSYLESSLTSRGLIDQQVDYFMGNMQFPAPLAGDGIITVKLEWGDEPDVDLHAFEPNGTQVYYANAQGISGYLDVDDTTGYGPEHYFVSCDTLETGTYQFGVNYYNGSGPETAEVQVEAGGTVRSFSVPLTDALGSLGNASPIPVADVVVASDQQGGFDFTIQGRTP